MAPCWSCASASAIQFQLNAGQIAAIAFRAPTFTCAANVTLSAYKRQLEESPSAAIRRISIALWSMSIGALSVLPPDWQAPGAWTTLFGNTLLNLNFCKTVLDNSVGPGAGWSDPVSPAVASVLGALSLAPVVGGYASKPTPTVSDGLALGGSLSSSTSGLLAILTSKNFNPKVSEPVWGINQGLIIIGGSLSSAAALSILMVK
ncbi:hypothetical protein PENFLA_c006G08480 [Penicillium flavigenum]|uniref:Uncharacterized protein n=1 Tax=Penicillium flavigenum TaxID=254877 RepID=A0A1V6TL15_9EURO|nr:hypothetical protein PENFLA_c006G08480 [Penicillium flavigenum]